MKTTITLRHLLSAFLLLLSWLEWVSWAPKGSYLRSVLPFLTTGSSYILAIALLVMGLFTLAHNTIVAEMGTFVSYRILTKNQALLNLGEDTASKLRLAVLLVLFLIAFLLLTQLPSSFRTDKATLLISSIYITVLVTILLYRIEFPKRIIFTGGPDIPEQTLVIELQGQLLYVYSRRFRSWKQHWGVVVLIEQKACIFHITDDLRKVLQVPIDNPFFNGLLEIVLDPIPNRFPDQLDDYQMARFSFYAEGGQRLEQFLKKAANSQSQVLLETIKKAFRISATSTDLKEDGLESMVSAFNTMLSEFQTIDPAVFSQSISKSIELDIFQEASTNLSPFLVSVNLENFGFTEKFEQVRQSLIAITVQLTTHNFEMQKQVQEMILALLPTMTQTSMESVDQLFDKLQTLACGVTGRRSTAPQIPTNYPITVESTFIRPDDINRIDLLRAKLSAVNDLLLEASEDQQLQYLHRSLGEIGLPRGSQTYTSDGFREFLRLRLSAPVSVIMNPESELYTSNKKLLADAFLTTPVHADIQAQP